MNLEQFGAVQVLKPQVTEVVTLNKQMADQL